MKQVTDIFMGAYIYNGAPLDQTSFRAFQLVQTSPTGASYPISYKAWNVSYRYNSDFLGGAMQDTLSGYQRGNPMGHRLNVTINLNNSLPTDSEKIRTLLNFTASRYDRQFWNIGGGSGSGSTVNFSDTNLPNDYFKGLTVVDHVGKERTIIASTPTSITTLAPLGSWNATSQKVIAKPSHPTIIGVSFTDNSSNIEYYNISNNTFGIERELTVGNQIIQLNLTGVFALATISNASVI